MLAEALASDAFVVLITACAVLITAWAVEVVALAALAVALVAAAAALVVALAASTSSSHFAASVLLLIGWEPLDVWASMQR